MGSGRQNDEELFSLFCIHARRTEIGWLLENRMSSHWSVNLLARDTVQQTLISHR